MPLAVLDWGSVIAALIAGVPATIAATIGFLNRREVRTPSGDTLGAVAERTHDLAATSVMVLTKLNGGHDDDDDAADG